MIEQLWYTWSTIGLGSVTGFRVRAASDGLTDIRTPRFQELDTYLRYELPLGTDMYTASSGNAPRSLILADTRTERIVVHKVYVGKDAYGRPGVFFSHLLASFPKEIPPSAIIELWHSPFWQLQDEPETSPVNLSNVELDTLASGSLEDGQLAMVKEYLPFVIQAFLLLVDQPEQKLYIAAPDEQVALLIWGLTRSLPLTLQRDLTFSTYESDLEATNVRIVGTSWAQARQDFPEKYYQNGNFAINCFSGKRSELAVDRAIVGYARMATDYLVSGNIDQLFAILEAAEYCQIQTVGEFLDLSQIALSLEQKQSPSVEEVEKIIGNENLAWVYLGKEQVQNVLLNQARADPLWWKQTAEIALSVLNARTQQERSTVESFATSKNDAVQRALAVLAMKAANQACTDLSQRNKPLWYLSINIIEAIADPAYNAEPWQRLFSHHTKHFVDKRENPLTFLGWEMQQVLLKRWNTLKIPVEQVTPWLQFDGKLLSAFLRMPLQAAWQVQAVIEYLVTKYNKSQPFPDQITDFVKHHKRIFEQASGQMVREPQMRQAACYFYADLVSRGYTEKISLLSLLLKNSGGTLSAFEVEQIIEHSQLNDLINVRKAVKKTIDLLLPYVQVEVVENLLLFYLNKFPRFDAVEEIDLDVLRRLQQCEKFPGEAAKYVHKLLLANNAVLYGIASADEKYLARLVVAIQDLKVLEYEPYKQKFYTRIIELLLREEAPDLAREVKQLTVIVTTFSPIFNGRKQLLLNLADCVGRQYKDEHLYRFFPPFFTVALNYIAENELEASEAQLFLRLLFDGLLYERNATNLLSIDKWIEQVSEPALKNAYQAWRENSVASQPPGGWAHIGSNMIKNNPLKHWYKEVAQEAKGEMVVTGQEGQADESPDEGDWIIEIDGGKIPFFLFEKIDKLKDFYVPLRLGEINESLKRTQRSVWYDEKNMLSRLNDPKQGFEMLLSLLKSYDLINEEINNDPERCKNVDEEVSAFSQNVWASKDYKKLEKKEAKMFSINDIKDVIRFFMCYRYLLSKYDSKEGKLEKHLDEVLKGKNIRTNEAKIVEIMNKKGKNK